MRTSDKLYNAKVKRAGSVHEFGEVEEGLRLAAAGVGGPAELSKVAAQCQPPQGSTVLLSGAEPGRQQNWKATAFQATVHCGRGGNDVSRPQSATLA